MVRTQINRDGSVSTWNDESGTMIYSIKTASVSSARLAEINALREFYSMSRLDQLHIRMSMYQKDINAPTHLKIEVEDKNITPPNAI